MCHILPIRAVAQVPQELEVAIRPPGEEAQRLDLELDHCLERLLGAPSHGIELRSLRFACRWLGPPNSAPERCWFMLISSALGLVTERTFYQLK